MHEERRPISIEERVENLERFAALQAEQISRLLEAMNGAGVTLASHRKALEGHQAALERLGGTGSIGTGTLNCGPSSDGH